jgi:hypothetical protein
MNSFDFYQKKKIMFDLDDDDDKPLLPMNNTQLIKPISTQPNIAQFNITKPNNTESNDITFAVVDT